MASFTSKITSTAVAGKLHFVSVGSVDGVLTTAGALAICGQKKTPIEWTQAFDVGRIDPSKWESGQVLVFVDLAVNNRDENMTHDFVRRVLKAGHRIAAIIDEHDGEAWRRVLPKKVYDRLWVKPVSQKDGRFKSSGALLNSFVPNASEDQARLLYAAHLADQMKFVGVGEYTNKAIKANISDNRRRDYIARHFAFNTEPDEQIKTWLVEYEEIMANNAMVFDARVELGHGLVRASAKGLKVDMTNLMAMLYSAGAKVVAMEGEQYSKEAGGKILQVSFGTPQGGADILSLLQNAMVPASEFANKANVLPEHEAKATSVVLDYLKGI